MARSLDLLLVLCFAVFFVIAIMIDLAQSLAPANATLEQLKALPFPPSFVWDHYFWWATAVDPMLHVNNVWYNTMAWFSPVLYAPFYLVAVYAILNERAWIRIPALLWAYGLLKDMLIICMEEFYGTHPTLNPTLFWAGYGPYIVVPLWTMLRFAQANPFGHALTNAKKRN